MERKTIKVSEATYQKLMEHRGDLIRTNGQNISLNDTIDDLLDITDEFARQFGSN